MGKTVIKSPVSNESFTTSSFLNHSNTFITYANKYNLNSRYVKTPVTLTLVGDDNCSLAAYRIHSLHLDVSVSKTVPLTADDTIYVGDTLIIKATLSDGYKVSSAQISGDYRSTSASTGYLSRAIKFIEGDVTLTYVSYYYGKWYDTSYSTISQAISDTSGTLSLDLSSYINSNVKELQIYWTYDTQPATAYGLNADPVANTGSAFNIFNPNSTYSTATYTSNRCTGGSAGNVFKQAKKTYVIRYFYLRYYGRAISITTSSASTTTMSHSYALGNGYVVPSPSSMCVRITRIRQRY